MLYIFLKKLVNRLNASYSVLYNDSGLIISDYYNDTLNPKDYLEIITSQINEDLTLIQKLVDHKTHFSMRLSHFDNNSEFIKKYTFGPNDFYLRIFAPILENEEINTVLENFRNELKYLFIEIKKNYKNY